MSGFASLNAPLATVDFDRACSAKPARKKRPSPLSVRLSVEQLAQLERDAMGMALNAYVLSKLFEPKKKRRLPTVQEQAIARALRRLGHSGIAVYLASQVVAQEEGRLMLSAEDERQLRHAYAECDSVRRDLVQAIGLNKDYRLDSVNE